MRSSLPLVSEPADRTSRTSRQRTYASTAKPSPVWPGLPPSALVTRRRFIAGVVTGAGALALPKFGDSLLDAFRGDSLQSTQAAGDLRTANTRPAGEPLQGWATLAGTEWPEIGAAAVIRPLSSPITVWSKPDEKSAAVSLRDGQATAGPVVLLAVGHADDWWKVLVPARPNETVGWVRQQDVSVSMIEHRIVVELSTNRLRYTVGSEVKLDQKVASGTGSTPTPTGLFSVKEIVKQKDPKGFLGPFALGLSGFSEVLYEYAGGQGTVAIHGTSAPRKIGQRVSHGCVRLDNNSIRALGKMVPLGTPVEIVNQLSDLPTARWSAPIIPQ